VGKGGRGFNRGNSGGRGVGGGNTTHGGLMAVLLATIRDGGSFTSLVMDVSKLTSKQRSRLWHWRLGHCGSSVPVTMSKWFNGGEMDVLHTLNEDCECCDKAKWRMGSFPANDIAVRMNQPPYWVVYCDGYGGQGSMGDRSYEGANGGFNFVCSGTGTIEVKLKASDKQFPIVLFNFLLAVETKHRHVAELWVDTYSVNISDAAEAVAAQFHTRIRPISAGTPQELAFAESSVRTIGRTSRAYLLGAPQLPGSAWGLSDLYSAYTHDVVPQRARGNKSPFELREGRAPPIKAMFIRVFGAPCQYAPMAGAEHKRAELTADGWFVGVMWPMVLVMRKSDMKVVSVSRKKCRVHEGLYILDPQERRIRFDQQVAIQGEEDESDSAAEDAIDSLPKAVKSIKSLREHKMHQWMEHRVSTEEEETARESVRASVQEVEHVEPVSNPSTTDTTGDATPAQGENASQEYVPEHVAMLEEQALQELMLLKKQIDISKAKPEARDRVLGAIDAAMVEIKGSSNTVEKGHLRHGLKRKGREEITDDNIIMSGGRVRKRVRNAPVTNGSTSTAEDAKVVDSAGLDDSVSDDSDGSNDDESDSESREDEEEQDVASVKLGRRSVASMMLGTRVAANSTIWDGDVPGSYSAGKPSKMFGTLVRKSKSGIVHVRWDSDGSLTKVHQSLCRPVIGREKKTVLTVMAAIAKGVQLQYSHSDTKLPWPKHFFDGLLRADWRKWVEATRKEMSGWDENNAYTDCSTDEIEPGAALIPLGELYSIKRDGRYKFRQIAYGNMLRRGKDYIDTFATTVTADGLRWFLSMACACGKRIRGWDARTGYLQAKQRVPLYCYRPTHAGYSNRSMEELALLRKQLLELVDKKGDAGLAAFVSQHRPNRKVRPKRAWRLNSAVYGVPDAGQAFAMLMQDVHINKCGLTQTEVDPSIYVRVDTDDNGAVVDYLICITWTDDVRYFGTDAAVKRYEGTVQQHLKCTLEGESDEFVSLEIKQDLEKKTLEVTQKAYWVKAVERFREYYPSGPKKRLVPITIADAALIEVATAEDVEKAKALPYRELLGLLNYPMVHTKLEGRYALSLLARHAHAWSEHHFSLLLKVLEYGYTTRDIGIIYSKDLDAHGINTLYAYADSGFSAPRSQGCRLTMMNGAAVSYTSARHSTTDDSTAAAELTECYLASSDVVGLRNLMAEMGCFQEAPTVLYQDNTPAISIANHRGSLARKSKAMDIRVFAIRNRIEDQQVRLQYLNTLEMIADLGTKALDARRFAFLRDVMNGYALVRAGGGEGAAALPSLVVRFD